MKNETPSELIGRKMLTLLDHPNAAELQATVIALAILGVYSSPYGKEIELDLLALVTEEVQSYGRFPVKTLAECVSAFDAALVTHAAHIAGEV